jgi:aminoglycoside phosphotransferase (APT) family kinase protein
MATAARALGELQRADLSPALDSTYRGELASLHRSVRLMRSAPDFQRLLETLGSQPIGEEQLVPAHGRLGPDRFAGDDQNLTILDWGRMCLASPALDAASFLARLRWGHLCRPTTGRTIEDLADVFRSEFLAGGPAVTADTLAAYEALMLARQAVRIARRPVRRGGAASRQVSRLLKAALKRLEVPRLRYHG